MSSFGTGLQNDLIDNPDRRALIAVDLGAESCRVSLLRWHESVPQIELVHRFTHEVEQREDGLRWNLKRIVEEVERGLGLAVELAPEGVRSIAVDGWAVDYVRIDAEGKAIEDPFCYRDSRNAKAEKALYQRIAPSRLQELTGVQLQPINTIYQQYADRLVGRNNKWISIPEYLLYLWGAKPVAERTNATHTGMLGLDGRWCEEIFEAASLNVSDAPELVEAGSIIGVYRGKLEKLHGTLLIAPCCHDTASAVAGIPASGEDWAYISSGTWSLIGTVLDSPCNSIEAARDNFTNLGAAGGRVLFHKGISGMWLLQQSMRSWKFTDVAALIDEANAQPEASTSELIDVDDQALATPGDIPSRINAQRVARGLLPITDPPRITRLIFESLAARYASVLRSISFVTGKSLRRVYVVGGGSQNELLNTLTEKATGLPVIRGAIESSTLGNFAVQLAGLEEKTSTDGIARWAVLLQTANHR